MEEEKKQLIGTTSDLDNIDSDQQPPKEGDVLLTPFLTVGENMEEEKKQLIETTSDLGNIASDQQPPKDGDVLLTPFSAVGGNMEEKKKQLIGTTPDVGKNDSDQPPDQNVLLLHVAAIDGNMEEEKKPLIGTTSDVGKSNSDQQPSKQDDVLLSPSSAVGGKSKLEETQSEDSSLVDRFFEKVRKLCESSGIPVIEETKMDLFKLYKEVIARGGFQKVLKDGKWDEVTTSFNSSNSCDTTIVSMEASDLKNIYSNILYSYEQIYHYRSPKKGDSTTAYCPIIAKRKYSEIACLPPKPYDNTKTISAAVNKKNSPRKTEEKFKREKGVPMSPRNAYQMYLRIECMRLKNLHKNGEDKTSGNQNFRDIAIESWRNLSQADRQPYVEESKKDKERFKEEMAAYMESNKKKTENITSEKKTENTTNEKKTSSSLQQKKDGYVVKQDSVPNESASAAMDVESTKIPNESASAKMNVEKKTENTTSEKKTSSSSLQQKKEDGYVVKVDSVPNESASAAMDVESTIKIPNVSASAMVDDQPPIKIAKNAEQSSSLFQVTWADGHGSLDLTE